MLGRRVRCSLVVLAALVAGCDLPQRIVGEVCTPGELGRDSTHVLRCSPDGIWEQTFTIEQGNLLFERLTANVATPGSPAPVEQTTGCPVSRRYALAAEGLTPTGLKYRALATTVQSRAKRGCACVVPRQWSHGMDPAAIASIREAMDDKEREAITNYGSVGIAPDDVPVRARTIFFRTTWRSFDEQACLRRVLGGGAYPPGESRHELGIAVDLEDWEREHDGRDERLLRARGWCRTSRAEGWHFEYRPALEANGEAARCLD